MKAEVAVTNHHLHCTPIALALACRPRVFRLLEGRGGRAHVPGFTARLQGSDPCPPAVPQFFFQTPTTPACVLTARCTHNRPSLIYHPAGCFGSPNGCFGSPRLLDRSPAMDEQQFVQLLEGLLQRAYCLPSPQFYSTLTADS